MNKKAEKFLQNLVKKNYQEIAPDFNETRKKSMSKMVQDISRELEIKKGERVLDLGCGNGRFLDLLSSLYDDFFYLGLDSSAELITYAQDRASNKFKFKEADILSLNKLNLEKFSYIFSWAVLHHFPGNRLRIKFFEEIYEILEDDGRFVFSVWRLRQDPKFYKRFFRSFFSQLFQGRLIDYGDLIFPWCYNKDKNLKSWRYYHAFSKKELFSLLKKTNFKVEKFLSDQFNYYFILKKK